VAMAQAGLEYHGIGRGVARVGEGA